MTAAESGPGRGQAVRVEVAAGILRDAGGRVLLAERRGDAAFEGLWEFPGGKLDGRETPREALCRELREELGIDVAACRPFLTLDHDYADRRVRLHFFLVDTWRNAPRAAGGQALRWVRPEALETRELLPADAPVVAALRRLR